MTHPRILLLIDSLGSGGAQRQIVLLFDAWRRAGVDVWLSAYYDIYHYRHMIGFEDQRRVTFLPKAIKGGDLRFVRTLRDHFDEVGPDAVVSFLRGPAMWVAMARGMRSRWKWLLSERSSRLDLDPPWRRAPYRWAARRADLVVPNSHTAMKEFVDVGLPERRVRVIPNGILVPPEARPEARPDRPFRVLMVGSMTANKNHLRVLRALVHMRDLPWVFDHVGRVQDDDVHRAIVNEVTRSDVQDRVTFHGEKTDLESYYRSAHLVVMASEYEGFPNVILEAWTWGCAVLVSDRGDMPHIVEHGKTGRVFSLDAPDDLEHALRSMITADPQMLRALGRAGHARVRDTYAMDAVAKRWIDTVETVVGR